MRKILAKDLKIKFIETLNVLENFTYENGNPFLININKNQYYIFLKNLSPAYFKNSPDVTRVQLPYSTHFSKIFKAEIPFIILGYDIDNDSFVCWNPEKIKERLNAKSNVSLYSRESLQSNVKSNEFKSGSLSNGEKIIIFKREMLTTIFENLDNLFNEQSKKSKIEILEEPIVEYVSGKLIEIKDNNILQQIKPLLKNNKVLKAVEVCTEYYSGQYKSMTFKDWFNLINSIYKSK